MSSGEEMPTAAAAPAPIGPSLLDSHERRIETVERDQVALGRQVAASGALLEQNTESVRALAVKIDQLPHLFQTTITEIVRPLHDRIEAVAGDVAEQSGVVSLLKKEKDERDEQEKRRTAKLDKYRASLLAVGAAGAGAIIKAVFDLATAYWKAKHGG